MKIKKQKGGFMQPAGYAMSIIKHFQDYFVKAGDAIPGIKCTNDDAMSDKEGLEMDALTIGLGRFVKKLSGSNVDEDKRKSLNPKTKQAESPVKEPMRIFITNEESIVTDYTNSNMRKGSIIADSVVDLKERVNALSLERGVKSSTCSMEASLKPSTHVKNVPSSCTNKKMLLANSNTTVSSSTRINFKKISRREFEKKKRADAIERAAVIARKADHELESKIPKYVREMTKELSDAAESFVVFARANNEAALQNLRLSQTQKTQLEFSRAGSKKLKAEKLIEEVAKISNLLKETPDDALKLTVTKETFREVLQLTGDLEERASTNVKNVIEEFRDALFKLAGVIKSARDLLKTTASENPPESVLENQEQEELMLNEIEANVNAMVLRIYFNDLPELSMTFALNRIRERMQDRTLPSDFSKQLNAIKIANEEQKCLRLAVDRAREEEVDIAQLALIAEMCVEWLNDSLI